MTSRKYIMGWGDKGDHRSRDLHAAIEEGNLEVFKKLLQDNSDFLRHKDGTDK